MTMHHLTRLATVLYPSYIKKKAEALPAIHRDSEKSIDRARLISITWYQRLGKMMCRA